MNHLEDPTFDAVANGEAPDGMASPPIRRVAPPPEGLHEQRIQAARRKARARRDRTAHPMTFIADRGFRGVSPHPDRLTLVKNTRVFTDDGEVIPLVEDAEPVSVANAALLDSDLDLSLVGTTWQETQRIRAEYETVLSEQSDPPFCGVRWIAEYRASQRLRPAPSSERDLALSDAIDAADRAHGFSEAVETETKYGTVIEFEGTRRLDAEYVAKQEIEDLPQYLSWDDGAELGGNHPQQREFYDDLGHMPEPEYAVMSTESDLRDLPYREAEFTGDLAQWSRWVEAMQRYRDSIDAEADRMNAQHEDVLTSVHGSVSRFDSRPATPRLEREDAPPAEPVAVSWAVGHVDLALVESFGLDAVRRGDGLEAERYREHWKTLKRLQKMFLRSAYSGFEENPEAPKWRTDREVIA